MPQKSTTCLLLLTCIIDNDMLYYLEMLKDSTQGIIDMYVIYDCAKGKPNAQCKNTPVYTFNSSLLPNFFHCDDLRLPNPLLALIDFSKSYRYDRYLLMEYDIAFSGDWRRFFQTIEKQHDADYIHIDTDVLGGPQAHWPIKFIKDNPFKRLYFSWCQLFLVSHRYLTDLNEFICKNKSIYYEFLLPTMAYNGNYIVKQFEKFGYNFQVFWGPADFYEHKYVYEQKENTFYHPVKNLSLISFH